MSTTNFVSRAYRGVGDAFVFPRSPGGFPIASVFMLAVKVANVIAEVK